MSKLSKLKSIKTGKIGYILPNITDSGVIDVINNCPQINSIILNMRPNITHKKIDALIALALRKPRIQFKHNFYDIGKSCFWDWAEDIVFNVIDLKSYQLPNNSVID